MKSTIKYKYVRLSSHCVITSTEKQFQHDSMWEKLNDAKCFNKYFKIHIVGEYMYYNQLDIVGMQERIS